MSGKPKILIIRFSSIGDIVLTSPVIRCVATQLNAEVHFLTKRSYHSIIQPNPYVHRCWTVEKAVDEVVDELKAIDFDYIVDLHKNIRSFQVQWALKVTTLTFEKLNWQKWAMVKLKINFLPPIHIVDRYLAAVEPLGVENDGKGLGYFIDRDDEVIPANFFPVGQKIENYLAFAIGAAHATKQMPVRKWVSICKQISQPIILIGGPGDVEAGENIAARGGAHVINTCGKLNLGQSASLIRQAEKVVTHDTGMMHVAAAFKKPIISIWGNTIPGFGMRPYYPEKMSLNHTIEIKDLSCRPCSKIGYSACPKGHFQCMEGIDTEQIVDSLQVKSSE